MPVQNFILATAGHVDHGKSALVLALTGTDPDRLPEEKARGITIDLGFAHLELPPAEGSPEGVERYSCGIVDVPGHEDFVKNMVAGVGSIDLALVVVAADDGWMPQTEEHLQILAHLGVTRAVVALTKIDLAAPGSEPALAESVRRRLAESPFASAPIVPTSVLTGSGLASLRLAIARTLAGTPPPPDLRKPRLWIDRVFVLPGAGTIVTGTLSGGSLARGDRVVVHPSGRPSRIRTCHSHGREQERVGPGTRAGFNLPDLAVADLRRGQVVTGESFGDATTTLDAVVARSGRLAGSGHPAARPLVSGSRVRLHLGSASVPARILLLQTEALGPGERGLAQVRLEDPLFAFAGDPFVLRDAAEQVTLAGGRVLDPDALRTHARDARRLTRLDACARAPSDPAPFLHLQLEREGVVPGSSLLLRSRFAPREVATALGRLVAAGEAILAGPLAAPAPLWNRALDLALAGIDAHHAAHPELPGLPLADLRAHLESAAGLRAGFEELVAALTRGECTTQGALIRRTRHTPALPPHLAAAGSRLRETLRRQRLDPPGRAELAPDPPSRQALRFLLQAGEVVELGTDLVITAEAYALARDRIRVFLRQRGAAPASDLRQLLGTTRRVLIPLLERLDRDGVTRRDGDVRRLAQSAS